MTPRRTDSIENRTVPVKMGSAALIIISTITTVASVMGTYYNLRMDIKDVANKADIQQQINDVRFTNMEGNQHEDHEWLRSLSHRLSVVEEQSGVQVKPKEGKER